MRHQLRPVHAGSSGLPSPSLRPYKFRSVCLIQEFFEFVASIHESGADPFPDVALATIRLAGFQRQILSLLSGLC